MKIKVILLLSLLSIFVACGTLTSNQAVYISQINLNLPNLIYKFGDGNYVKLFDGVMVDKKGPYTSAYLENRILNADFNKDGYTDAAVILVVDGWRYVFVVLQSYSLGPVPSNGFRVPLTTGKNFDRIPVFSMDSDNKNILLEFWASDPNQYNAPGSIMSPPAAVPTLLTLKYENNLLSVASSKIITSDCFPFVW